MCGEKRHDGSPCASYPKCANCQGDHKSMDNRCEVYQKHYRVNVLIAYDNMKLLKVRNLIFGEKNKVAPLRTKENYPDLRETK